VDTPAGTTAAGVLTNLAYTDAKHFKLVELSIINYQFLPYLIAPNPSDFWQNSPYNSANSWWQMGDENHVIK